MTMTQPSFLESGYKCPSCDRNAHQIWYQGCAFIYNSNKRTDLNDELKFKNLIDLNNSKEITEIPNLFFTSCINCGVISMWVNEVLIYTSVFKNNAKSENVDLRQNFKVKVFVSYSWDSEEHKDKIKRVICDKLKDDGIDVIADCYQVQPGTRITRFMENGISSADKVIIVCTERYTEKAARNTGGVAYEESIISGEILENLDNEKFIPVFIDNPSRKVPPSLKGVIGVNFQTNEDIIREYPTLLNAITK